MMIVRLIIGCLIATASLAATDYRPWFGNTLEIETCAACQLQGYRKVSTGEGTKHHPAIDLFFDLSAATSFDFLAAELEAVATDTRYRRFGMDCIKLTGRYRWLNDIVGDPVSLVTGLSIAQVFKPGLRNLSSFHHGGIECEAHVAVGRERSFMQYWFSRYWAVLGVGIADMGYPWIRGDYAWEYNFCEKHILRLFANSLWGLGYHHLHHVNHFHGYGSIRHQSIDLGARYSFLFNWGGTLSLEYAYRVFARNCPKGVNIAYLSLCYPFGL